jgi:hypothetical protein
MVGTLVDVTNQFIIILAGAETKQFPPKKEAEVKKLTTWLNDFPRNLEARAGK